MADQSASVGAGSSAPSAAPISATTPDWKPAVGDVVEFDKYYGDTKGIVFSPSKWNELISIACETGGWCSSPPMQMRKVGECELLKGGEKEVSFAIGVAKAYFAQPTFTGTYEERQKQWIEHHGLEKGDMLEVVRDFEDNADGYNGTCKYDIGHQGRFSGGGHSKDGIRVGDARWFPYFALEPVVK